MKKMDSQAKQIWRGIGCGKRKQTPLSKRKIQGVKREKIEC